MFCTNCGNKLGSGDNFCGKCGTAIHRSAMQVDESPAIKFEKPRPEPITRSAPIYEPPVQLVKRKTSDAKEEEKKQKLRAELKVLLEKRKGKEVTDEEVLEAEINLTGLARLMLKFARTDWERKQKLKANPKGFHLEGIGYTCAICRENVSNEQTWYDKYGIKCLVCQKAVDDKIIPASAARDADSWYSEFDLKDRFNLNHHALKKFIKEGVIKPRIVPNESGKPHAQIFLIEDNKDTLPPKELTKSQGVSEVIDGKTWFHSEPWYKFVDPVVALKGYKIMDHLKVITEEKKPSET